MLRHYVMPLRKWADENRNPSDLRSTRNAANSSPLEEARRNFEPLVPEALLSGAFELVKGEATTALSHADAIAAKFPKTFGQPFVDLVPTSADAVEPRRK